MLKDQMFYILGQQEGQEKIFHIRMNPDHFIYRAHFPGNPITPGVCIVQVVTELLETLLEERLSLCEVKSLKFVDILSPLQNPEVEACFDLIQPLAKGYKVKGILRHGDHIFTKYSLTYERSNNT